MTAEQFALWLQGFAELTPESPNPEQWTLICAHLATVFEKVTPPLGAPEPEAFKTLRAVKGLHRRGNPAREDDMAARRAYPRDRIIC